MTTINALFNSSTSTFTERYRALDFSSQLFIWIELRERVLSGNQTVFVKYLMPLLAPITESFKATLPTHGTYREDFAQEAMIAVYSHLTDYSPYYNGCPMLGTVYFKNCIRTACTNVRRQVVRDQRASGCDDFDAMLEINDMSGADTAAEDYVIREVMEYYEKMCAQYSSTQYARKMTRKWLKAKKILLDDILS